MTLSTDTPRCGYCRRPIGASGRPGRPRRYCKRSHRQRAYEARRRASALHVPGGQLVVDQAELDRLHDLLYALEAALQDVEQDLADRRSRSEDAYRQAFLHLFRAADDLRGVVVEATRS